MEKVPYLCGPLVTVAGTRWAAAPPLTTAQDNCNCDGYATSIFTITVSSTSESGAIPWYSEPCSATIATTYSSGTTSERQIVTTDLHHKCTTKHTGTR